VITLKQRLPDLKVVSAAKEPERIEVAAHADEDSAPPRKAARKKKPARKSPARTKSGKV
jgi:hypothetical protein